MYETSIGRQAANQPPASTLQLPRAEEKGGPAGRPKPKAFAGAGRSRVHIGDGDEHVGTPATWIGIIFLKKKSFWSSMALRARPRRRRRRRTVDRESLVADRVAGGRTGRDNAGRRQVGALAACVAWYGQIVPNRRGASAGRLLVSGWRAHQVELARGDHAQFPVTR